MDLERTIQSVKRESSADLDGLDMFLVGGAVRDALMGKESQDLDFVVVDESPEEMVERGFRFIDASSFPVFQTAGHEFALARAERSTGEGHNDFDWETGVSLEDDLARRDLTINSIAADENGELIDPFDGQDDIKRGIVRHTTSAFSEDPLRVLRAARFCSRFDFTPHVETLCLCRKISDKLNFVSGERVAMEMMKSFKQSPRPSRFFKLLARFNALSIVLPEIAELKEAPSGPEKWHNEGDAFEHTMMALDMLHNRNDNPSVRENLAVLSHDLGKTTTEVSQWPHHHGHPKRGVEVAERLADRLALSNEHRGVMTDASEQHMRFLDLPEMRPSKIIRLVERLDDSDKHISPEELLTLADADRMGRMPCQSFDPSKFENIIREARIVIENINGQEILDSHPDKEPGQWVGDSLIQERQAALKARI